MPDEPQKPTPHVIWWFAHIILGVISGLVVYVLYHNTNHEAARRHLIFSIIIMVVGTVVASVALLLLGHVLDDPYLDGYTMLASTL